MHKPSDGITLEQGSSALITKNNILDNLGFGINNLDPSLIIDAQANWWGDAGGPGGAGPGFGDEVSTNVDFTNWLMQPVAVVAAAELDTVTLPSGSTDTVSVFFQNWQKPDDVLNVSISDEQVWLQEPTAFSVTLSDSLGADSKVAFAIPAGTVEGTANRVQLIATSQADPSAADTAVFTVLSQTAILVSISVVPDSVALAPGDSVQFRAEGLDQFGRDFAFTPEWTATGGNIDVDGLYIAGTEPGTFYVTASDPNTQLQQQALVLIDVTVALEETPTAVPKDFHLYQNYPNPFNPTTAIKFDLPKASRVTLKIYNILGEEVATLVSDWLTVGSYTYQWDASRSAGIASGVYLYQLEAGDFLKTRKMILLK
jgi:hypothetical protein